MAEKLTDRLVRGLEPPPTGNRVTYDTEVKGFGIRVTAAGARAFILNYTASRRERRLTIGTFPSWSTTAARERAKELRREIDRGIDPLQERNDDIAAPTINDLIARYVETHLPRKRPSSVRDDRSMIASYITPRLGSMKVSAVSHTHIEDLHRAVSKSAPVRANRIVALLSKMFSLGVKWGWRGENPAHGIERNPEERRERYLSSEELARLSEVLGTHPEQTSANAVRLLLLTGARKTEVLGASWDQFDLISGVWVRPSAHTKQKKLHRVPLSEAALQLLVEMREKIVGDLLFPGRDVDTPLKDIKRFWASVSQSAGIADVRLHDLRHTFASILASAGISLPTIGALLGHSQPITTSRYSHLADDPLRAATERVAAVISSANVRPVG